MYDFLIDIVPKDNYVESYINPNDVNLNDYFDNKEGDKKNENFDGK